MIERAILWGISRAAGGPGRALVWTVIARRLLRVIRSTTGRRPVVDVGTIRPGQRVVIEHRTISHGKQIKQFKAEAKQAKQAAKRERRAAARAEKRTERDGRPDDVERSTSAVGRFRRRSGSRSGRLGA